MPDDIHAIAPYPLQSDNLVKSEIAFNLRLPPNTPKVTCSCSTCLPLVEQPALVGLRVWHAAATLSLESD
jgi:hypothetical protein